jgi:GTP-binding protein
MGEIPRPLTGAWVADRSGVTTPYALYDLQQRGELFVGAGTEVNGGMIHRRDLAQKTISTSTPCADEAIRLVPDRALNMEQAIDFHTESAVGT